MSRFPEVSTAGAAVPASIFARLREHLARFPGDVIPLQIGDTHLAPPATVGELSWTERPVGELYAYGHPRGWPPLVEAIAARARDVHGIAVTAAGVQVTIGATHALTCAVQAACDPGDELLLLTPHWPLIRGIALAHNVVPVEVPFSHRGATDEVSVADAVALIEAAITPRTTALYFATPNNPDGAMLGAPLLAAIVALADRHALWLLADEVYADYGYDATHVSIASLPGAGPRTITVGSFAKSHALAGVRVGYAVGAEPVIATLGKLANHSVYNVPVAMQRVADAALAAGGPFLGEARTAYRVARDRARARLRVPTASPPGGAYLWLDLRPWSGDDAMQVLERCAAAGVLLAPGRAFGEVCAGWARLCFTGVPPDRLDEGIDRINAVIDGVL